VAVIWHVTYLICDPKDYPHPHRKGPNGEP
jgi:hypothetical protein